jgi:peptidoglycan/xylan/chitin deacetylase (PgdA/CDA1 family)
MRGVARRMRGFLPDPHDAPAILMYHRVAEPPWDPWGMCVPPALFREQLQALKAHRALLSMDELVEGLLAGALPPQATALTFDDGYSDNLLVAKPILEEIEAPATLFITAGMIGENRAFWWDELARLVLAGRKAVNFAVTVAGAPLVVSWPEQERLPADLAAWRVRARTTEPRRLAFGRLWRALQQMTGEDRDAALAAIVAEIGSDELLAEDALAAAMSPEMVRAAPSRWIGLGAHGCSHAPLTALPLPARRDELATARRALATLTGGELPPGMAYPHGSVDEETRDLVAQAGYRWAVTSQSARVDRRRFDPLALPRLEVGRRGGRAMLRAVRAAGR